MKKSLSINLILTVLCLFSCKKEIIEKAEDTNLQTYKSSLIDMIHLNSMSDKNNQLYNHLTIVLKNDQIVDSITITHKKVGGTTISRKRAKHMRTWSRILLIIPTKDSLIKDQEEDFTISYYDSKGGVITTETIRIKPGINSYNLKGELYSRKAKPGMYVFNAFLDSFTNSNKDLIYSIEMIAWFVNSDSTLTPQVSDTKIANKYNLYNKEKLVSINLEAAGMNRSTQLSKFYVEFKKGTHNLTAPLSGSSTNNSWGTSLNDAKTIELEPERGITLPYYDWE